MVNEQCFKQGDIVIHKESGKRLEVVRSFCWHGLPNELRFKEIQDSRGYYVDVLSFNFVKAPNKYK